MGKAIMINSTILPTIGTVSLVDFIEIPITGISIQNKPSTVIDNHQLSILKYPLNTTQNDITWVSSNNNVATVSSSGYITVLSVGDVTITARSSSNSSIYDSCLISCQLSNSVIPITGINITNKQNDILDNLQLTYDLTPSDTTQTDVTWISSDITIATISNTGYVNILDTGNILITLISSVNSNVSDSFTASCAFSYVPVQLLSISGNATASVGSNIQLYCDVYPGDSTNKNITWASSDTSIATVSSSGLVTTLSAGDVTITCTSVDNNLINDTKLLTISQISYVTHKLYFKQANSVNGVSSWTWTDSKSGVKVNKNYFHNTMPSTIVNSSGSVVSGITKMTLAEVQLIDINAQNGGFVDQPLTGANSNNCDYDLTMIKNISTPHPSASNVGKCGMGMWCPNGTYHYKILLGCAVSKLTNQALLKINNTVINIPEFNCLDNLNTYIEGDFVVSTGYLFLTLDKQNYSGSNPIGFSLTEIDMSVPV